MNLAKIANNRMRNENTFDGSNSITISEYIINSNNHNKLIYCRFGEKYI